MRFLRSLSLVWLVLVLVTGSVIMAMARHQARAVDQMVICTGYGIVTVSVDEDGNPTGPILPCPDSTPALAALSDTANPAPVAPGRLISFVFRLSDLSIVALGSPTFRNARAPPVRV